MSCVLLALQLAFNYAQGEYRHCCFAFSVVRVEHMMILTSGWASNKRGMAVSLSIIAAFLNIKKNNVMAMLFQIANGNLAIR